MVARSGLDCALGLGKDDAGRAAAIVEMEAATRKTVADASLAAAADDVSTSYLSLIEARKDAGDAAGARKDAEAWAAFLEAQAAAAKTPEQRAVFDSHRLSAYLELQQPERAIPMLQESEKDLPDDYNPPSRLAVAYMAMKKPDEALAASNRALPKVSGPRRVQVLQRRSDIFAAKGDAAASREALEQALACAKSLPAGQRSEGQIRALKKKLEAPPAKPQRSEPPGGVAWLGESVGSADGDDAARRPAAARGARRAAGVRSRPGPRRGRPAPGARRDLRPARPERGGQDEPRARHLRPPAPGRRQREPASAATRGTPRPAAGWGSCRRRLLSTPS